MAGFFRSNREAFNRNNEAMKDMIVGHMALDIEVALKSSSGMPVKTGAMKASARHFRGPSGQFRVEVNKSYAAYQERGARMAGDHIVRHYTTSGTSKGWFRRAINSVWARKESYVAQARRAIS